MDAPGPIPTTTATDMIVPGGDTRGFRRIRLNLRKNVKKYCCNVYLKSLILSCRRVCSVIHVEACMPPRVMLVVV